MQTKRLPQTAFRFSDAENELIAALKVKTGIRATSELMRLALKEMAERRGVRVESETE